MEVAEKNACILPNDVLTNIFKRHVDAKVLLCISMASKQFASLVSDIDALTFDYQLNPGFPSDLDRIINGLLKRFRKLQHLHIVSQSDNHHPTDTDELIIRCQASIGSEFEHGYVLLARPVAHGHLSEDDSSSAIDSYDTEMESLTEEQLREYEAAADNLIVNILQKPSAHALSNSRITRWIVSKNTKFKSIAISDQEKHCMVFMGEDEIARSRSNPTVTPYDPSAFIHVTQWDLPLLKLPKLGCALYDVHLFALKAASNPCVEVEQQDVLQRCVWSNYDKDWDIFREASKEIMLNDNVNKKVSDMKIMNMVLFGLLNPFLDHYYSLFAPPTQEGNEAAVANLNIRN